MTPHERPEGHVRRPHTANADDGRYCIFCGTDMEDGENAPESCERRQGERRNHEWGQDYPQLATGYIPRTTPDRRTSTGEE